MKVEHLNKKTKQFDPIEIKLKIESFEELKALHKLIGGETNSSTPGSGEIFYLIDEIYDELKK